MYVRNLLEYLKNYNCYLRYPNNNSIFEILFYMSNIVSTLCKIDILKMLYSDYKNLGDLIFE